MAEQDKAMSDYFKPAGQPKLYEKFKDMKASKIGTGFMKLIGQVRRSPEKRQCIADQKQAGASGREARQYCRQEYGSGIGNLGRALGLTGKKEGRIKQRPIFPAFDKSNGAYMSPSGFAMPTGPRTAGATAFQWWWLLPIVLFVPGIRKLIGFK